LHKLLLRIIKYLLLLYYLSEIHVLAIYSFYDYSLQLMKMREGKGHKWKRNSNKIPPSTLTGIRSGMNMWKATRQKQRKVMEVSL